MQQEPGIAVLQVSYRRKIGVTGLNALLMQRARLSGYNCVMRYVKETKIKALNQEIERLVQARAALGVSIERLNRDLAAFTPRPAFERLRRNGLIRIEKTERLTMDTVVNLK